MEPTLEQTKALLERAKAVLRKLADRADGQSIEDLERLADLSAQKAPIMMSDEEEA